MEKFGEGKWKEIASHMPGRDRKKLRDHYVNFLKFPSVKGDFSEDDDVRLSVLTRIYGRAFTKIASYFPGRSTTSIRNRCNALLKDIENEVDSEHKEESEAKEGIIEENKEEKKEENKEESEKQPMSASQMPQEAPKEIVKEAPKENVN